MGFVILGLLVVVLVALAAGVAVCGVVAVRRLLDRMQLDVDLLLARATRAETMLAVADQEPVATGWDLLVRQEVLLQLRGENEAIRGFISSVGRGRDGRDEYLVLEPAWRLPGDRPVDGAAIVPLAAAKWAQLPPGAKSAYAPSAVRAAVEDGEAA